jgi:tRNA U34 5-carboxymethylaminomethyl modifying enzyme MnmG/GidA
VVLTNGTFKRIDSYWRKAIWGESRRKAYGITEDLIKEGFEAGRMKTGTPPRVDGRSLDYSKMNEEKVTRVISFHTLMLLHRCSSKVLSHDLFNVHDI